MGLAERTDAEASTLWPPDAKSWLIGKDPDAGKARRQDEKGMTEDKSVGWHHQHNGHEFKQVLGDGEGQGSLARSTPWGRKVLDSTEWLNNDTLISVIMDWSFLLLCLLVILHWMSNIIRFPLRAWYFSIPKLILELYSEILLRCLETVWSFWVLLFKIGSVGPDVSVGWT